jgi:hypothetical protein
MRLSKMYLQVYNGTLYCTGKMVKQLLYFNRYQAVCLDTKRYLLIRNIVGVKGFCSDLVRLCAVWSVHAVYVCTILYSMYAVTVKWWRGFPL